MPDAITMNGFVQHAVVSAVALGALAVVLRRVFGVFDRRPPASSPGMSQVAPGCSHCAAGAAAQRKHARQG
jgi:hypothetical protein